METPDLSELSALVSGSKSGYTLFAILCHCLTWLKSVAIFWFTWIVPAVDSALNSVYTGFYRRNILKKCINDYREKIIFFCIFCKLFTGRAAQYEWRPVWDNWDELKNSPWSWNRMKLLGTNKTRIASNFSLKMSMCPIEPVGCLNVYTWSSFQHRPFPFRIHGSQWRERGDQRQAGREPGAERRPGEQLQLGGLLRRGAERRPQAPGREPRQQTPRHGPQPVLLPQLSAAWTVIH